MRASRQRAFNLYSRHRRRSHSFVRLSVLFYVQGVRLGYRNSNYIDCYDVLRREWLHVGSTKKLLFDCYVHKTFQVARGMHPRTETSDICNEVATGCDVYHDTAE